MEIYLQQDGQQTGPFTEEQLQETVASGAINQFNLARHDGINDWQPLCTIIHIATPAPKTPHLPTPKTGTPHLPPPPTTSGTPHLNPPPPAPDFTSSPPPPDFTSSPPAPDFTSSPPPPDFTSSPPPPDFTSSPPPPDFTSSSNPSLATSSTSASSEGLQMLVQRGAIIGGWACFALGVIILLAFSWPFYIHFALFVVAVILSIEALSQHKIISGLSLLLTTLLLPTFLGFGLLFLQLNKDVETLSEDTDKQIDRPVETDTSKVNSKVE